jgi:hypothetical protein
MWAANGHSSFVPEPPLARIFPQIEVRSCARTLGLIQIKNREHSASALSKHRRASNQCPLYPQ